MSKEIDLGGFMLCPAPREEPEPIIIEKGPTEDLRPSSVVSSQVACGLTQGQRGSIGKGDKLSPKAIKFLSRQLRGASIITNGRYNENDLILAVDGWAYIADARERDDLKATIDFAQEEGGIENKLEYHIEHPTYELTKNANGHWDPPFEVYARGGKLKPNIPGEVVDYVRAYVGIMDTDQAQAFLLHVHSQVHQAFLDSHNAQGDYATAFVQKQRNVAPVLRFFADQLKAHGKTEEAYQLEIEVNAQLPLYPQGYLDLSQEDTPIAAEPHLPSGGQHRPNVGGWRDLE